MKKLIITSGLIMVLGFFSCKKETVTSTSPEEIATGKPPSPPPPPSILQWQKTYGGTSSEMGYAITSDAAGNYVFTASALTNSGDVSGHHGGVGADAWVVKINSSGLIGWSHCFGGTNGDYAYDILSTTDGSGYVFAGVTKSSDGDLSGQVYHGERDVWVAKLNASTGDIVWQKTFGGSADDWANSIIETNDGGFLVVGSTSSTNGDVTQMRGSSDVWIIKLDNNGNMIWQKTYGGSLGDAASSVTQVGNELILCAGSSSIDGDLSTLNNHGGSDSWVFRLDLSGNLLCGKTYGGTGGEGEGAIYPVEGGYVFSTTTNSSNGDVSGNHGYVDTWVVKIDASGNKIWQKCFGGTDMDNANIVDVDATGKIVLVGYSFSKNGDIPRTKANEDLWVVRVDASNGNKLYSDVITGGDMANDAVPTNDGMYMTSGRGNGDAWLVKFKF
jgi:hypothetical protein